MSEENYGKLDDLDIPGEADVENVSEDYYEGNVPPQPGWYYSAQREVEPKKEFINPKSGAMQFRLNFGEDGLVHKESGEAIKFPPFCYIDTHMFKVFRGAGMASSVGRYLAAVGVSERSMTGQQLVAALKESQGVPVYVEVEWEDSYKDRPEGAKPVYTKAFKVGAEYKPAVTLPDGRKVTAMARIRNFKRVE